MSNIRNKNPFGRNHGVHRDQEILVDHGSRRRSERMECENWEGNWTGEENYYLED